MWNFFTNDDKEEEEEDDTMGLQHSTELSFIKNLIRVYFKIVKRNLIDYVPKAIITLLVNDSCDIAEKDLVIKLYKEDNVEALMTQKSSIRDLKGKINGELESLYKC